MNHFDESDVRRDTSGKFADKPHLDAGDGVLSSDDGMDDLVARLVASGELTEEESPYGGVRYVSGRRVVGRASGGRVVGVEVAISRRKGEFQTTDHDKVTDPYELSVIGFSRDSSGQIIDTLRDVSEFEGEFDHDDLDAVDDMWSSEHLNGMRAGCDHQEPVFDSERGYRAVNLDKTPACPHSGYRYGSSWLTKPLDVGKVEAGMAAIGKLERS